MHTREISGSVIKELCKCGHSFMDQVQKIWYRLMEASVLEKGIEPVPGTLIEMAEPSQNYTDV